MHLVLTNRDWWKEIGAANLSGWTKARLRGAVNAYLQDVFAPATTEAQFNEIQREVNSITFDGVSLELSLDEGQTRRLRLTAA